jgi:acyl-CoA dehydrogenase
VDSEIYQDAFQKLLEEHCKPSHVRAIEAGGPCDPLWRVLEESGFLGALTPEGPGGAGLSLDDVFPLLRACGAASLPAPLPTTMVAHALLVDAGLEVPRGSVTFAQGASGKWGELACTGVPWGMVADFVLVDDGAECTLLSCRDALRAVAGTHGSLAAEITWDHIPDQAPRLPKRVDLMSASAALLAALMAGAMKAILDKTIAYANERKQFGKSIGRFQAIQQQLSIMAEQTSAVQIAAQIGCRASTRAPYLPSPLAAAAAKARASEAVALVAPIAHAVHGAIGVTYECDLHLLTRRLHEWRLSAGAEGYWHRRLGEELIPQSSSTLDFLRAICGP